MSKTMIYATYSILVCMFLYTCVSAKEAQKTDVELGVKPPSQGLKRIKGELDLSVLKEVLLRTSETTQLSGKFAIVVTKIDDLVNEPEFIGFRPVYVVGKLNYRRQGTGYECQIQWEKVCLLGPAFHKVKRIERPLVSKLNYMGHEIPKDFLITARGDIAAFIKTVQELFKSPIASESDLSEKEREKLTRLNKMTFKDGHPSNLSTSQGTYDNVNKGSSEAPTESSSVQNPLRKSRYASSESETSSILKGNSEKGANEKASRHGSVISNEGDKKKDPSSKSFGDTTSETSSSSKTQSGFSGKRADSTSSNENQDLNSEPLKERMDGHDSQNSDAIHPSSNLPSSSQEETGSKTQAPP